MKKQNVFSVKTMEILRKHLLRFRKEQGLTQEEFASLSGISYKYYQHVESGRRKMIRIDTLERLAKATGQEPWQLIRPTTDK